MAEGRDEIRACRFIETFSCQRALQKANAWRGGADNFSVVWGDGVGGDILVQQTVLVC